MFDEKKAMGKKFAELEAKEGSRHKSDEQKAQEIIDAIQPRYYDLRSLKHCIVTGEIRTWNK